MWHVATVASASKAVKLTCTMPAKVKSLGGRPGAYPDGKKADEEASKVRQHVSSVCQDGKTVCKIAT